MKKKFLFILIVLFARYSGNCQNFEMYDKTKFYELVAPTFISNYKDTSDIILAESKLIFSVITTVSNGDYIIQFWTWSDEIVNKKNIAKYIYKDINKIVNGRILDDLSNLKIFRITAQNLKENAIPYYSAGISKGAWDWSSGIVILPLRTRHSPDFTFSKDLTLGLSGGGKMRISHRNPTYINFLVNIGITSITIDSLSTKGKLRQSSDRTAFTPSLGIVLENHSFQFGFFIGKDRLSINDTKNTEWIYNNKPWIAFGIGYQIFSANSKNKNTSNKNTQPSN